MISISFISGVDKFPGLFRGNPSSSDGFPLLCALLVPVLCYKIRCIRSTNTNLIVNGDIKLHKVFCQVRHLRLKGSKHRSLASHSTHTVQCVYTLCFIARMILFVTFYNNVLVNFVGATHVFIFVV